MWRSLTALLTLVLAISAQAPPRLEFEVATIKPTDTSVMRSTGIEIFPGGRVVISRLPLKTLVSAAFGLPYRQISGGEEWMEKETYDIEAKPPETANIRNFRYTWYTIEDIRLREMLQALLIDRFQLKFHRETKIGYVYLLTRTSKPFVLQPKDDTSEDANRRFFGSIGYVGGQWSIFDTTMPQLAQFASAYVMRAPVLDRTEISGAFDRKQTDPDPQYLSDNTDAFLRFLSELGLKLERTKGPVETVIIDHADKPSVN